MIHFELFLSPSMQESLRPPNKIRQLKKYIWALIQEKMVIPAPFHSKALALLYKFETSCTLLGGRPWPGVQFFLPSQESPNFAFHEPAPDLTC